MRVRTIIAVFLFPVLIKAQSAPITIDGYFSDWVPSLATFADPAESISGIDLLDMQVTNDADHLFIKLSIDTELDLTDMDVPHRLFLYLDTDNDASTGFPAQAGYGTELGVDLSARTAHYNVIPYSQVAIQDHGHRHGPTFTSTEFEIAIARNAVPDGLNPLFTGNTIKILFRELNSGDEMPNVGLTFSYTFDSTPVPFTPIALEKQEPSHVRLLAYNVQSDGLNVPTRVDDIEDIVISIDPDIIGLSECINTTTTTAKALLDSWIPIGGAGWHVLKDDHDLITASRWPILNSWTINARHFPTLIDLPSSYGTDLLFTNVHLNCCTNDLARQAQVDEYAAFILDAKTPGGNVDVPMNTPFVIAGDMNFVGFSDQINTLLTGNIQDNGTWGADGALDWDGTDCTDQVCRHSDAPMAYTWRNDNSTFTPGRLDYLIYSDAVTSVANSYTLCTEAMSSMRLSQYGLRANNTGNASDHLPLVADMVIGPQPSTVEVDVKVVLEGPFDGVSMDDDLRVAGYLPLTEPYTALGYAFVNGGGETMQANVLTTTGPDAIVDWVVVELRDPSDPANVASSCAALLQRDGDVVRVDGTSSVGFPIAAGQYFVAVRHRNHLGVMTSSAISLSGNSTMVDLSSFLTPVFGVEARRPVSGTMVMWAGNVNGNGELQYTGLGNDRDPILQAIGGSVPTNIIGGYHLEDVNMDGTVQYTGLNNDRDPILVNIGGSVPTNVRHEQLP